MTDTSRHAAASVGTEFGLPVRNIAIPSPSSDVCSALSSTSAPHPSKRGIRIRVNSLGAAIMFKQNSAAVSSETNPSTTRPNPMHHKPRLRSAAVSEKDMSNASSTPTTSPALSLDQGTVSSSATSLPLAPNSAAGPRSPPVPLLNPRQPDSSSAAGSSSGFNRRKFFGRSNSIRNLFGGGGSSSSASNTATGSSRQPSQDGTCTPSPSSAVGPQSHGLLRRMGSKSTLNLSQTKGGPTSNSSTDDLLSLASVDSQASRRFSDSLKGIGRRRGNSVSKRAPKALSVSSQSSSDAHSGRRVQIEPNLGSSRKSIESARSSLSTASIEPQQRLSEAGTIEAKGQPIWENHDQHAGAPRRLTGWLYNMIGSDNTQSSLDGGAPLSPVREADVLEPTPSSPTKCQPNSDSSLRSPSRQSSTAHIRPEIGSPAAMHANSSSRSKTGKLFQGLTNAASNKAMRAISASTGDHTASNSTSSSNGNIGTTNTPASSSFTGSGVGGSGSNIGGWVPGSVGFDRAFKFFMDTDDGSGSDEGIWLLGVWHGPRQTIRADLIEESSGSSALPKALTGLQLDSARRESEGEVADMVRASTPTSSVSASSPRRKPVDLIHASMAASSPAYERASTASTKQGSHVGSSISTAATVSTVDSLRTKSSATSFSAAAPATANPLGDVQFAFQPDFASRIWCTYRNHFAPISRDGTISEQAASAAEVTAAAQHAAVHRTAEPSTPSGVPISLEGAQSSGSSTAAGRSWLGRKTTDSNVAQEAAAPQASSLGLGAALGAGYASASTTLGEKMGISNLWSRATAAAQAAGFSRAGLTTDSGWGCMLRTGQSLLANALINVHLGRSWQREAPPMSQVLFFEELANASIDPSAESESLSTFREKRSRYATYVKILSWFLDDPSPACPFGVHRMAREGKRLGKEVGEWFGPSTAAGAIKQLVSEFPDAGIAVELAHDGVFYLDEIRAAASSPQAGKPRSSRKSENTSWRRPVLILIGIRLGLDSVNPIYYESVKATFSFPHSVGIAGGRPSSSYYFMGHQGNSLFYLDPHNVRPAVPLRYPPNTYPAAVPRQLDVVFRYTLDDKDDEEEWWSHAYSEAQTSTFHCEKVRRMPIKSLDPSMLLGFLVKDEEDLLDFCTRIKALPKTIFSFAESTPNWVDDDDFDPSMESFSDRSAGGESDNEADEGKDRDSKIKTGSQEVGKESKLAQHTNANSIEGGTAVPFPRDAGSTGERLFRETQQRTAAWLGHGQPNSSSSRAQNANAMGDGGIAFPSLDLLSSTTDGHSLQRPSRSDARQVSTSSAATTRPSRRETTNVLSADRLRGQDIATQKLLPSQSPGRPGPDESFSTVHLSDSEVGSAWEEVSDGGTIAPSGSSGVAYVRTSSPMHTLLAATQPTTSAAVPVESSKIAPSSASADDNPLSPVSVASEGEFVGISLDTPVNEAPSNPDVVTPTDSIVVLSPSAVDAANTYSGASAGPVSNSGEEESFFSHTSAHTPLALPRRRSQSRPPPVELPSTTAGDAPPVPSIPAGFLAAENADASPKKARAPDMNDSDDDF